MKQHFFYRLDTLQIDAAFRDCTTESVVYKDVDVYAEVNVTNPPYTVNRDHKVTLENGEVVDTEPSVNPVQPALALNPLQDCIDTLTDPEWGSGVPAKVEIVRTVLLRMLGVE